MTLSRSSLGLVAVLAAGCSTHLDPIGLDRGTGDASSGGADASSGGADASGGKGGAGGATNTGGKTASGGSAGGDGSRGGNDGGDGIDAGSGGVAPGSGGTNGMDGGTEGGPANPPAVTQVVVGERHTCVLLDDGSVKCWGGNLYGQLGYGNTAVIGDDEPASSVGTVSLTATPGITATALAAGQQHTCAVLSDGSVKCWGDGASGRLGYGDTETIGDDELPSSVGPVHVTDVPGVVATALVAGWDHTCALLSNGTVTCWGELGLGGGLGYGNADLIGDDEDPASAGPIRLAETPGVTANAIYGGAFHVCARLSDASLVCWGRGSTGQLGYGDYELVGDDELPSSSGAVSVTTAPDVSVIALAGGSAHTCAALSDGSAKCWGDGGNFFPSAGIGYGNTEAIGDDELPSSVGAISVSTVPGTTVTALCGGFAHTCALLSDETVHCWGWNIQGQLGYGHTNPIGDDELPSTAGPLDLGLPEGVRVTALSTGTSNYHVCAVLSDGALKCWGLNSDGELGYGRPGQVGDDELPSAVGTVPLF